MAFKDWVYVMKAEEVSNTITQIREVIRYYREHEGDFDSRALEARHDELIELVCKLIGEKTSEQHNRPPNRNSS